MKKQYLTVDEASTVSKKHSNTIRELIKSNKIEYTKENRKYLIKKESLALYYKAYKDDILSFGEDNNDSVNNNVSNSSINTSFEEHLKPLVESLQFHIKKYDDVQKLLTNSNQEKIELEISYNEKIQNQELEFSQEKESIAKNHKQLLSKKEIFIKILFGVIGLLLVSMLLQSKILTINF